MTMNFLIYGAKSFFRRRRTSVILILLFFVSFLAMISSRLIGGVCGIYKAKNENPYSDYYRLIVDPVWSKEHGFSSGFDSKDSIGVGSWYRVKAIHEYFTDITDYTAELTWNTQADADPLVPGWLREKAKLFCVYGLTDCMELRGFVRGEISVVSGRRISRADRDAKKNVCMISETVAGINGLSVGDTLNVEMFGENKTPFEIVGVYSINVARDLKGISLSCDLEENRIYVPLSAFDDTPKYKTVNAYNYQVRLSDASLAPLLENEVNALSLFGGDPSYFIRVSDIYEAGSSSVHALEQAVLSAGSILSVFTLLLTVTVIFSMAASRKKETGICLALGTGKTRLALSLTFEISLCIVCGAAAALPAAYCLGPDLSAAILKSALENVSAEALAVTTSDTVHAGGRVFEIVESIADAGFVTSSVMQALSLLLPAIAAGFAAAFFGIFREREMLLLTKQEDSP